MSKKYINMLFNRPTTGRYYSGEQKVNFESHVLFSKCLRAKIYSNMNVYFDPLGCQTLLLKESKPLPFIWAVVEGFAMTNANYVRAIDLLKERFGKQQKITHAAVQALIKLPAPSSKVSSLRNFYDKMETYNRSLEAMGQCQESFWEKASISSGLLPDPIESRVYCTCCYF